MDLNLRWELEVGRATPPDSLAKFLARNPPGLDVTLPKNTVTQARLNDALNGCVQRPVAEAVAKL